MNNNKLINNNLPQHIAIVMDGNGRWAQKRFLPRIAGHKKGVETIRKIVKFSTEQAIQALTLFAFSSENWQRGEAEVKVLMTLLRNVLDTEIEQLHANNIKLIVIGDLSKLSTSLQQIILKAQQLTQHNQGLKLNIAINYGGKWDIANAAKNIAQAVLSKAIQIENINEELVSNYISLADLPPVDLFIRTSGEQRISNFLLWQLAYAEIYFTKVLWPDFNEQDMQLAIDWFSSRERKFGKLPAVYYSNLTSQLIPGPMVTKNA